MPAAEQEKPTTRFVLPLVGLLVGLLEAFHPTILSGFSRIQTDIGDTRFNNFMLEHGYRWITGRVPSFWDPPFFFPVPNAAAYSDTLLGAAPIYWLFRVVGFLPDTAFQLWQLGVSALNFGVFYWFLRRNFGVKALAAIAGAWIFAFGGPRIAQTMHIQLFPQFFTIIALHGFLQVFRQNITRQHARRYWLVISGVFALQLYASYYLAWFLLFGVFVALVWALFNASARARLKDVARRDGASIALAAGLAILVIAPMALHYVRAARETGLRHWFSVRDLLPRPLSWFAGDQGSWFYRWTLKIRRVADVPFPHEQSLTFGFLTLSLSAWGLWRNRKEPIVGLLIRVALTLVILSTLFTPTRTLWQSVWAIFPGARALRAVTRVVLLISIPVGIGVSLAIDRLQQSRRLAWASVLSVVCLLEQGHTTPSFSKEEVRARIAAQASRVSSDCSAFFLSPVITATEQPDWLIQMDPMWVSLAVGVPTLNGYSGNMPHDWPLHDSSILTPADEPRLTTALKEWSEARGLDASKICWVRFPESPTQ